MEKLRYKVIAVFTDASLGFRGNPSAVVLLDHPMDASEMQEITAILNYPATTFLRKGVKDREFQVRWFAPDAEIGLCGHGAAAAAVFLGEKYNSKEAFNLIFKSGEVRVKWLAKEGFELRLSAIPVVREIEVPGPIKAGLNIPVLAMYETGNKHIVLTEKEDFIRKMRPDFHLLRKSGIFGYAVTAKGDKVDFVSRTLVPHVQQLEDHATGSSHAMLVPFWAEKLSQQHFLSHQLSSRGGLFKSFLKAGMVLLKGSYMVEKQGEVNLP